jgi:hypothetical protein
MVLTGKLIAGLRDEPHVNLVSHVRMRKGRPHIVVVTLS